MSLRKRTLSGILSGFTKVEAELTEFISEQHQRQTIAESNLAKLDQMKTEQELLINDAASQIVAATNVKARISELTGGPVSLGI